MSQDLNRSTDSRTLLAQLYIAPAKEILSSITRSWLPPIMLNLPLSTTILGRLRKFFLWKMIHYSGPEIWSYIFHSLVPIKNALNIYLLIDWNFNFLVIGRLITTLNSFSWSGKLEMANPLPNAARFCESKLYKCVTLREILPPLGIFISMITLWVQNCNRKILSIVSLFCEQ